MGVRADMTPQVARIDNTLLNRNIPVRLCYLGTVLHTRTRTLGGTRAPMQIGAELYGHAGVESDAEILSLMLMTLQISGVCNVYVDIGHVGVYRGLIKLLEVSQEQEAKIFSLLQKKARSELDNELKSWKVQPKLHDAVLALMELYGDETVFSDARRLFKDIDISIINCIDELEQISELTLKHVKDASLMYDLSDLGGYNYHNGMMFTAYRQGQGQGIAFGGRYNGIGKEFGRARPATGFSADVKLLYELGNQQDIKSLAIYASGSDVPGLHDAVNDLRKKGEKVIYQLSGQAGDAKAMGCDRELYLEGGRWKVRGLT
jgi:ATP phosphoribosyltransferase regulatory subunit